MTNYATINAMHASGWQLLSEFTDASFSGSDSELLTEVTNSMQELLLPPLQRERIHAVLLHAVTRAPQAPLSAIRIRIWVLGSYTGGCGWGYFLVEKRSCASDSPGPTTESEYLVELFLYQEQES